MLRKILAGIASASILLTLAPVAAAQTTLPPLVCSPTSVAVEVGQSVTLAASGGDSALPYSWSVSPPVALINPTGMGFTVNFTSAGTRVVTVTNGARVATCTVFVNAPAVILPPAPDLPAGGAGGLVDANLGLMLLIAVGATVSAYGAHKLGAKKK